LSAPGPKGPERFGPWLRFGPQLLGLSPAGGLTGDLCRSTAGVAGSHAAAARPLRGDAGADAGVAGGASVGAGGEELGSDPVEGWDDVSSWI